MSQKQQREPVIAVYDGENIYTSRSDVIHPQRPLSQWAFGGMAEACSRLGISQLWLIGDHPESQLNYSPEVWPEWDMQPSRAAPWVHAVKRHSSAQIDLVFPGIAPNDDPWHDCQDAQTLLAALVLLRVVLKGHTGWHRSGGATAARLVRALHTGPHALPLELGVSADGEAWPTPARDGNTETPLAWIAAHEHAEKLLAGAGYVHAYDKNGAYLSACSALKVGAGRIVRTGALDLTRGEQDAQTILRPGYYLVDTKGLVPTERGIPSWSGHRPRGVYDVAWVTLPTLQLMIDRGEAPTVYQSFTWEASHRPLEPFYALLRDARMDLQPGGALAPAPGAALALSAVKAIYASFCGGYLASTGEKRGWDRSHDTLYRPDMRHAIIATARTNLVRRVEKVYAADGWAPLAIGGIDTVFYASADPWPLRFAAEQIPSLPVGDTSLRGWKYKGTAELTPALRDRLLSEDKPTKVLEALFTALRDRIEAGQNG